MKRIIVGISDATGAIYGIRLLQKVADIETHLVLSCAARRTIALETGTYVEDVEATADQVHKAGAIAAPVSSGSFRTAGMVVVPCSMKIASGIASCYSDNLLPRAADVTLKERRPLVRCGCRNPMPPGDIRGGRRQRGHAAGSGNGPGR